jgi:hypothetical protein
MLALNAKGSLERWIIILRVVYSGRKFPHSHLVGRIGDESEVKTRSTHQGAFSGVVFSNLFGAGSGDARILAGRVKQPPDWPFFCKPVVELRRLSRRQDMCFDPPLLQEVNGLRGTCRHSAIPRESTTTLAPWSSNSCTSAG